MKNHVKWHIIYKCIHIIHGVDILLLNVQCLLTCMYKDERKVLFLFSSLTLVEWMHMRECCDIILLVSMTYLFKP